MRGRRSDIIDETGPRGYVEPSFGQRLLARVVDALVLGVPLGLMSLWIDGAPRRGVGVAVVAVYEIVLVSRSGQTLGKRALGIRVVDLCTGRVPSLSSASIRWLTLAAGALAAAVVPALDTLASVYALAVVAPILRPPLHRGLHDLAATTVVTGDSRPLLSA